MLEDMIYKETALKRVSWDSEAYNAINMIPIINDAVKVVRCKDCLNWDLNWKPRYYPDGHYCPFIDLVTDGEFYCSYAERKVEDGN